MLVNTQRALTSICLMSYMPGKQRVKLMRLHVGADRADIGAHVGEVADAQREEFALLVERQLALGEGVARLAVAEERLGAGRHPVHRPPGQLRGDQDRDVVRIGAGLEPERAADVLGDDAQRSFGQFMMARMLSRSEPALCEQARSV